MRKIRLLLGLKKAFLVFKKTSLSVPSVQSSVGARGMGMEIEEVELE